MSSWEDAEKELRHEAEECVREAFRRYEWRRPRDWKVIQDVLEGSSRFEAWEIAIIDTPIVQRLRRIGQTGMSSQLYPCANATRFEHALGVAVVTKRIINALNARSSPAGGQPLFSDEDCYCARAAALLHDVGHGPFSHCSEYFCVDTFPGLKELVEGDDSPYTHCKAHEILSAFMVETQPVADLFRWLEQTFSVRINADKVARMILQRPPEAEDHLFYVYQVINGPFDADKLDYIRRDSYATGLQMTLEVDRLIHSLSKGSNGKEERPQEVILVGAGGVPAIEQILFSKMLLTTALYHHHKVRAVEAMLSSAFRYASEAGDAKLGRALRSPVDFLYLDDLTVLSSPHDDSVEAGLIRDVLERRLVKRALAITTEALADPAQRARYFRVVGNMMESYDERRQLQRRVCAELEARHVDLGESGRARIIVDFPKPASFSEPSQTYIQRENGQPQQLDELFSMENWLEAYRQFFYRGHIFAPDAIRPMVGVVAKRVLKDEYGIELSSIAHDLCKYPAATGDWRDAEEKLYGRA